MNVLLLLILQILCVNACVCACAQLAAVSSRAPPRSTNLSFHSRHKVEWREKKYFLFRLSRGSVLFPSLSVPLVFGAFFLFLLSKLHSASIINGGMNGDLKGEKKPGGFKKRKKSYFPECCGA